MRPQSNTILKSVLTLFLALAMSCSKNEVSIDAPDANDPCTENPCANPEQCSDRCAITGSTRKEGAFYKEDIKPEGNITETENGYMVIGDLTIETDSEEPLHFSEAELDVEFNDDGSLKNISGTTAIPAPSNYFEFESPIQADIGMFTGKFLNENRNVEIRLKDEITYFVFAISVGLELKVGANDDPSATKPVSISPPIGGKIAYIADYSDPMFFFSLGGGALGNINDDENNNNDGNNGGNNNNNGDNGDNNDGEDNSDGNNGNDGNNNGDNNSGGNNGDNGNGNSGGNGNDGNNGNSNGELLGISFGASAGANFIYEPTVPVENVISFNAKSVTGGTFSFWKVLEASGMYYQNRAFGPHFNLQEPMQSEIGNGYRAGINGSLDLSLDIASFISFGFPIGKGSAAFIAETNMNGDFVGQAFINGQVDPDLSWWPNFIPVKPGGKMNAYGYIEETGAFDIGLSGMFGIEMPSGTQGLEGSMRATHQAFTMAGKVTIDDEVWGATAIFTKSETKCISTPPNNFSEGIAETVTEQIDNAIATTEEAVNDLEKANEQYEFELSLRGLRKGLPAIMDRATAAIDKAVSAGVSSGRSQANKILKEKGRTLCSDNISSQVNSIVRPYRDALTRLKKAVDNSNDNTETRAELEAALRQLIRLKRINKTIKVSITTGNKKVLLIPACTEKFTVKRNVKIERNILTNEQIEELTEAADNVKNISEAHGIRFDAQVIVDQLPTVEELQKLKKNIEACVNELTSSLGDVGFVYNHDSKQFKFFIVINGKEKQVDGFDIFNGNSIIEMARFETSGCNGSEQLKRLMQKSKSR